MDCVTCELYPSKATQKITMYSWKLLFKMTKDILDGDVHREKSNVKTNKPGLKEANSQ